MIGPERLSNITVIAMQPTTESSIGPVSEIVLETGIDVGLDTVGLDTGLDAPAIAPAADPQDGAPQDNAPLELENAPSESTPLENAPAQESTPTEPQEDSLQEPGGLLQDLERRQDDVLEQLDELDAKLIEVLKGLGATLEDEE